MCPVYSPLPVAPRPYPDELLSSSVGRVAAHYHAGADELITALTEDASPRPRDRRPFDLEPGDEIVAALAKICRIDQGTIRGMTFSQCKDPPPWSWLAWRFPHEKWPHDYSREDLMFRGVVSPSFCPECLHDDANAGQDAYIRREWAKASRGLCVKHAAYLKTSCPHCLYSVNGMRYEAGSPLRLICFKCHRSLANDAPRAFRSEGEKAAYHALAEGRRYLVAFENSLTEALCGRTPDDRWFGPAEPAEFVRMVEDLVQIIWGGAACRPDHGVSAYRPLLALGVPLLDVSAKGSGWRPSGRPLTLLGPQMRTALLMSILRFLRLNDLPPALVDRLNWSPTFRWLYDRSGVGAHRQMLLDRQGWPRALSDRLAVEFDGVKLPTPPRETPPSPGLGSPQPRTDPEATRRQAIERRKMEERYLRVTKEVYTPEVQRSIARLPRGKRDRQLRAIMSQIRARLAQEPPLQPDEPD